MRDPRRAVLVLVAIALAGATAFGLWHVVGGFVNGNDRAAAFGALLATVAGSLMAGVVAWNRNRAGR